MTESVSEWQGHLLSCSGQLKSKWEPMKTSISGFWLGHVMFGFWQCPVGAFIQEWKPIAIKTFTTKYAPYPRISKNPIICWGKNLTSFDHILASAEHLLRTAYILKASSQSSQKPPINLHFRPQNRLRTRKLSNADFQFSHFSASPPNCIQSCC